MKEFANAFWPGWETVRQIGSGSFGSVYEIRRDVFGDVEQAALKVITIPHSQNDIDEWISEGYEKEDIANRLHSYLQDIVKEYSLMAKMKGHTNVVYCDDLRYTRHEDGIGWDIYIKMELLTPMLATLGTEIPPETAVRVGRDLCNALILCRHRNIVHRDIKPQNIFVSDCGDYKLGDFGIAKTAEKTTGGTKIGTYKYMAPEVYNNQPYGLSADIYSLGIVLYWLLNERRTPFLPLPPYGITASVEEEARRRRFAGEPLPEPAYGSPELKAIVLKAWAFNPKQRYATPEEMLADLNSLSACLPDTTKNSLPPYAKEPPAIKMAVGTPGPYGTASLYPEMGRQAPAKEGTGAPSTENRAVLPQYAYPFPEQNKTEDRKKKPWPLFAGIAAGMLGMIILFVALFGGSDKKGEDIFNGAVFPEMFYGYYEAEDYYYDEETEDASKFLKGMEYFTIPLDSGDYEFAVLPASLEACKYSHTVEAYEYEGQEYYPCTPEGLELFRDYLVYQTGTVTEEQFSKIEKLMNLDVIELYMVDTEGKTYSMTLHYTIEKGQLCIYDMSLDDDYNFYLADIPMLRIDFRHHGPKLTLSCKGVERTYVPFGYKETDPGIYFSGFSLDKGTMYKNIEGLAYTKERSGYEDMFVLLENGEYAVDPVMEIHTETGEFTLSWTERSSFSNEEVTEYDPTTITGKIVPCASLAMDGAEGFFLFIDGECYQYTVCLQEYLEMS